MISAAFTGLILTNYENAISSIPLLVSFIPMLMGTGGNCGSQSSTLIIRGLAVDEVKFKDIFRVIWKELRISLIAGTVLAVANGIRIYLTYRSSEPNALLIAAVVSASLIVIIVAANLIGCVLPLLASKIKLDPALLAAPLLTTIIDSCAIFVFFSISSAFLPI